MDNIGPQNTKTSDKPWQELLLAQFAVIVALLFAGAGYKVFSISAEASFLPLTIVFLILTIWFLWSWKKLTNSWFDPYSMFIVAAFLFHGGQTFLIVLNVQAGPMLDDLFRDFVLVEALYLVILGMAVFHLGALSAATFRRYSKRGKAAMDHRSIVVSDNLVHSVGWVFVLIAILPTIFVLRDALQVVQNSGYFGLFQRESTTGFGSIMNILAAFLVPGALFLVVNSKGKPLNQVVSAIIILTFALTQFVLGSRATGAMPLIAYAWLWHRTVSKLPRTLLIVSAAILLFVLFPLVKLTRHMSGEDWLDLSQGAENLLESTTPVISILREMGGSLSTVAYTLELVPSTRGFEFGQSYLYATLTVVPNFFWDIHPTIAHGLAADWLVQTVEPILSKLGGGLGYSFIAEAYLNFGWLGAPLLLGLIGFLFAGFVLWAQDGGGAARMAVVASFVSFFMIYARGESGSVVRALFWYALLPYMFMYLISDIRRSRNPSKASQDQKVAESEKFKTKPKVG